MPEPPISGNGSGSWHIPTPTPSDVFIGNLDSQQTRDGSMHSVNLPKFTAMWPTPVADGDRTTDYAQGGRSLGAEVRRNSWPTPRNSPAMASGTSEQIKRTMEKTGYKRKLEEAIVQWPTPRRSEYKGCGPYGSKSYKLMLDRDYLSPAVLAPDNSGVLSPDWTAWLMGLPQNWVTLEPVSEESFAEWETRMADGSWWEDEHDLPRTVPSRKGRVDMLKALGNGIVPRTIPTFLNYARSN